MKIGILGGGQLGRMFIQEALKYDDEFHVLDPNPECSCAGISHFVKGDFNDYDDMLETVTLDCTKTEIDIIANLMFEMYLFRDIAKLKSYETSFTPKDLTVFSSSESRKSFMSMYNEIVSKNINMIDAYNSRDRLTGKRKTVDYTQYYEV